MGGWGWAGLLLICCLPTVVPQDLTDEKWGDWDSVSCYACGLATVDPESDEAGSYGVTPNMTKKMYNHSCDLMDHGVAYMKDKNHGYDYSGQDLNPRTNVRNEPFKDPKMLEDGTQECINVTTFESVSMLDENNETVTERTPNVTCVDQFLEGVRTINLPRKDYDLSMWLRRCPKKVRSCFKAEGNWDLQRPSFRGCAGASYPHGTTCRRELQRVATLPGRPKVDVEVFLCYCTEDGCNKDTITAGAERPILRLGGFVNSMVWNSLLGVALYIMMD